MPSILYNSNKIRESIPSNIIIVAAAKTQTIATIQAAYDAGIRHFGHNYLQEAMAMKDDLPADIIWRMIGHLQRNKINKAIQTVNTIDTLDSLRMAKSLNQRCEIANIKMPVMIEVNSATEENKSGVLPEDVLDFASQLSSLDNLSITGVFTMGKAFVSGNSQRPYFQIAKQLFDELKKKNHPNFQIQNLSMGMSASYEIAIEEGATMIRLGTALFGKRT